MELYYFAVSKRELEDVSGGTKKQFERELKRKFKSYDFMCGYALGYGFGKIEILTPDDIEHWHNNRDLLQYKYVYAVSVEDTGKGEY